MPGKCVRTSRARGVKKKPKPYTFDEAGLNPRGGNLF